MVAFICITRKMKVTKSEQKSLDPMAPNNQKIVIRLQYTFLFIVGLMHLDELRDRVVKTRSRKSQEISE